MNDLHSRLSTLADDLAPDADPYAQAAGARRLHRRQRRTRLGAAGAVAAVAVLVLGVPAAVTTLSAPDGDVAAPGPPTVPTASGGEDARRVDRWTDELERREREETLLAPLADGLRARLSTGAVLTAPDAEQVVPCPDAAAFLGTAVGVPLEPGPGPTTATGCSWSTADAVPEPDRVLLTLRNDPELTSEGLVRDVQSEVDDGGCHPTALPGSTGLAALVLCRQGDQLAWRVTALDGSGAGAWVLTAATGSALEEDTGARALVALRDVLGGL